MFAQARIVCEKTQRQARPPVETEHSRIPLAVTDQAARR